MSIATTITLALMSPIAALLGVWIGAKANARSQEAHWQREHDQRLSESTRASYLAFMAAIRDYISYVASPDADVTVARHSTEDYLIPIFGGTGVPVKQHMEVAFAELRVFAADQKLVDKAHQLARAARRIAVAHRTTSPEDPIFQRLQVFYEIEREFLNIVRKELGMAGEIQSGYDPDARLP